jgi:hypothetical protein
VKCFGGIYEIHAVLRREWEWGKLGLIIFWVLGGGPREGTEEGGQCMFGGTYWLCCLVWGGLASDRARGLLKNNLWRDI